MSRPERRQGLDSDIRVRMLEEDLDRAEENIITARTDLDAKIQHARRNADAAVNATKFDIDQRLAKIETQMERGFTDCEERDERNRKLLSGLLVSIVMLCVSVTVGVLVALGGG